MSEPKKAQSNKMRNAIALGTIAVSVLAITILAGIAINKNDDNAMMIFNMVLPVLASWVGTILAFYFGRENFESANQQVRELVQKLTPEQRANTPVSSVMRMLGNTVHHKLDVQGAVGVLLSALRERFTGNVSRLPILDADEKPLYMIHESRINQYLAGDGDEAHTLQQFLDAQPDGAGGFGLDEGFVVVSEATSLAEAKRKMEANAPCQDIFVTRGGNADEPLLGWLSNVRLAKYLEV